MAQTMAALVLSPAPTMSIGPLDGIGGNPRGRTLSGLSRGEAIRMPSSPSVQNTQRPARRARLAIARSRASPASAFTSDRARRASCRFGFRHTPRNKPMRSRLSARTNLPGSVVANLSARWSHVRRDDAAVRLAHLIEHDQGIDSRPHFWRVFLGFAYRGLQAWAADS